MFIGLLWMIGCGPNATYEAPTSPPSVSPPTEALKAPDPWPFRQVQLESGTIIYSFTDATNRPPAKLGQTTYGSFSGTGIAMSSVNAALDRIGIEPVSTVGLDEEELCIYYRPGFGPGGCRLKRGTFEWNDHVRGTLVVHRATCSTTRRGPMYDCIDSITITPRSKKAGSED